MLLTVAFINGESELITRNNIIFDRNSEITLSRNSWKLCYVIDLAIYDVIFGDSLDYINLAENMTTRIITTHKSRAVNIDFTSHYVNLRRKLTDLNSTRERLVDSFNNYKTLQKRQPRYAGIRNLNENEKRVKRALIPIGSILSGLFGVGSQDDIDEIRRVINKLGTQQKEISHILAKSLTVFNQTQIQVSANRAKLNEIIDSVHCLALYSNYRPGRFQSQKPSFEA